MKLHYSNLRRIPDEIKQENHINLKKYSYNAVDKSILSRYVLKYIWDASLKLFPKWLAPNIITILGGVFILISLIMTLYFDFDCSGKAPSFVYFLNGIFLFLYMLCDAVDGKQARRTSSGSPLGQLFDHMVDSLVASAVPVMLASAMKLGISLELLLFLVNFKFCVFFANLEEFHTHNFVLSIVNGPTEGILSGIAVFFVAAYFKPSVYSFLLRNDFLQNISNLSIIGFLTLFFIICFSYFSIFRNLKFGDFTQVILNSLTPITLYLTFFTYFTRIDTTTKFYILLFTEAFNFSIILLEMIYATLTKSDIPTYSPSTVFFIMTVLFRYKDIYLYLIALTSIVSWLILFQSIINEICDILNIKIFSIPYNQKKKE